MALFCAFLFLGMFVFNLWSLKKRKSLKVTNKKIGKIMKNYAVKNFNGWKNVEGKIFLSQELFW